MQRMEMTSGIGAPLVTCHCAACVSTLATLRAILSNWPRPLWKRKKLILVEKIKEIFEKIKDQKKELKEDFSNLDARVKQLTRRNTHLHNNEAALSDLLVETRKANDISSITYLQKAVGEFHFEEKKSGGNEAHSGEAESQGEAAHEEELSDGKESEKTKAENPEGAAAAAVKTDAQACQQQQQSSDQPQVIPRAVIDYRDGRLLLHSLAEPAISRLSLQVPSEVFLELSAGGRCLGRVYINLWCHMRQAQQFLTLCMGTLGPSLLGTKASEKVRNVIVFRSAVDRNNQSAPQALLMGLEWGGQHSKTESEGLITGMAGNNGIAFGICTQGQTNAAMNAPFGNVVTGLEAAKEAFQHNPVTEVTITDCGIVLPGLSQ